MPLQLPGHNYRAIGFLLLVAFGLAVTNPRQQTALPQFLSNIVGRAKDLHAEWNRPQERTDEAERPADFLVTQDRFEYQGYTIERRLRKVLLEYPTEGNYSNRWVDVAYVNVKKVRGKLRKFDADIYFALGNSADFGFFPFLGHSTKQLFISQDVPRRGCQWVVSLYPRFKVIFDGHKLGVGREASDLGAVDLDHDGVYEIVAPITDFYAFHDKMSMSKIPLPDIIFKYQPKKEKYLPANSVFKADVLEGLVKVPTVNKTLKIEFQHRAAVLSNLLTYIYVGEKKQGWDFYDKYYQLDDKEEIRRRVKKILRDQPMYNLIYNHAKRK